MNSTCELVVYTPEEIEKHNTPEDLWIIIDGIVYDVSQFAFEHPGGKTVLIEFAGQDATEAFEDLGHSSDARRRLGPLAIGKLASKSPPKPISFVINIAVGLTAITIAALASYYFGRGYIGSLH